MDRYQDFYFELRRKIDEWLNTKVGGTHRWSGYILAAPDLFHLLVKLLLDKDVPETKKLKIAAVIFYFISPIDFLPEAFLGPVGYLDDVAISAYVLNDVINEVDPIIITRNWAGDRDVLALTKTILQNANRMIGSGLWMKLKRTFAKI